MSDGSGEKLLFSLDEGQHSSEETILGLMVGCRRRRFDSKEEI